ncbi:MAG: hypothetical protein KH319_02400 [Butyricicoccus pullicaecorum]|nr:hypothetical protein [Butyricicoccus pullicaecorum]
MKKPYRDLLKWALRLFFVWMLYMAYTVYAPLAAPFYSGNNIHADVGKALIITLLTCLTGYLLVHFNDL